MKDHLRFLAQGDVWVVNTIPNQEKRSRSSLKGKDGVFALVQRETEIFGVTHVMMHVREGGAMGPEMPLWKES